MDKYISRIHSHKFINQTNVTSRGERVLQSMEIQYSQTNIKGDMSNFMKNSEDFISNQFFCGESSSHT